MKLPRSLAVFLFAAGAALTLAVGKALLVSGLNTLPPIKVVLFASCMFGLIAALLNWAVFEDRPKAPPIGNKASPVQAASESRAGRKVPDADAVQRARARPIVFREVCQPSAATGMSFYGGVPIGPAKLEWPRGRNKPESKPLSFLMQWDCAELASQDPTGLLPRDGVLYFFCDLTWGEPFDFQFVHAPGPVTGMRALPIPPDLPQVFGNGGAYDVPYCSPEVPKNDQDVPRLLPKWPFTPIALSYPGMEKPRQGSDDNRDGYFWNDSEGVGEALLLVQHPGGVPPAKKLSSRRIMPFERPFPTFPHDHAAVRIVARRVLDQLRRPSSSLLRESTEQERQNMFQIWRTEAQQRYAAAAAHSPGSRVDQPVSDETWRWIEGLKMMLTPGWASLVDECVNVSLGLGSEAAGAIPADLIAVCEERHRLALAYLHEESPDRRSPESLASWEARKREGSLKEVRSVHASCPNHMFGPASFVQGDVEEYLEDRVLLLELSSRTPIGLEFGEGVLQFLIRPADLRERRFDKVELVASAY